MSVPKLQWDGKVNIATLALILGSVLSIGGQMQVIVSLQKEVVELKSRIAVVEDFKTEIATIKQQIIYTAQAVERIDRRTEERERR